MKTPSDWSSVARGSEEETAFCNERVAYFGKVICALSLAFLIASVGLTWLLVPIGRSADNVLDLALVFQLLAAAVPAAQWLVCRRAPQPVRVLDVIDAGGLLLTMVGYAVMAAVSSPGFEQALLLGLTTMAITVTRAVIVPSTARRTLWVSVIASLPALVATYVIVTRSPARSVGERAWLDAMGTPYIGLWCATTVAISTLASRVIYGLAQRVREATELGQYTLEEKIGQGGMGVVYRARHALLRRPTAVKLLPGKGVSEQARSRFEREVQLTSALTHPNTIAIYDYGHTPDGVFYYAMEYLDGITLEELVTHDGPQPPARVVHLLRQIAGALSEAHGVGLIHRDIKPANVMLCNRAELPDFVKVLDFGLVKDLDQHSGPPVTGANALIGTPHYLAPEAIVDAERVDARTDIYALGAVAYFLLEGAPPFRGGTLVEVCAQHVHEPPPPLTGRPGALVPAALEALVMQCLAKDAGDRPASARTLLRQLDGCAAGTWAEEDSRKWWSEAAPEVLRKRTERRAAGSSAAAPATIVIDYGRRGASLGSQDASAS